MQVSATDIILIVGLITTMTLIVVIFLLAYVAVYNKRKKKHVEEKDNMKQAFSEQLLQAQLEIQEQTSRNISEEIHDNVGQVLSLSSIQLNMLIQHPEKAKIELAEIKENIDLALEDLRGIARNLNGSYLQQISINEFLQKQQRQLNRSGQHLCEMYTSGTEKNIPVQHKIILFRILQECLQNIIKHAQATEIILRTAYTEDQGLKVTVQDNGVGFNVSDQQNRGLGIGNMERRMHLLQGEFAIESNAGQGTTIHLNIPSYD